MTRELARFASVCLLAPLCGFAGNTVDGSLTANGDVVPLRAVAVEPGFDQVGLLMTEGALPDGCGVYDAFTLGGSGKLRGIAISISKETRQMEPAGIKGLYHASWEGQLGNIGDPEVNVEQFDDKILKGSISLASGSFGEHAFSYEARFEVDLAVERPALEAKVSGAGDSQAAQAYAKYYEAMMAGRLEEGKKYVVEENAKQMVGEDAEMFLEFFQDGHPLEATITSADQTGDKAKLAVEGEVAGCMSTAQAQATVEMAKESGVWKVEEESWEL